MNVKELRTAVDQAPAEAIVNVLVRAVGGEEWRELKFAYPDRELCGGKWRDSLTLVVGEEVE